MIRDVFAVLCIHDPNMLHDDITRRLGIAPTSARARFDIDSLNVHHDAYWILISEDHVPSDAAAAHLEWLLDRLHDKGETIAAFRAEGLSVRASLFSPVPELAAGQLDPSLRLRFTELGLDLTFESET